LPPGGRLQLTFLVVAGSGSYPGSYRDPVIEAFMREHHEHFDDAAYERAVHRY
jgi:hypothetical protein